MGIMITYGSYVKPESESKQVGQPATLVLFLQSAGDTYLMRDEGERVSPSSSSLL